MRLKNLKRRWPPAGVTNLQSQRLSKATQERKRKSHHDRGPAIPHGCNSQEPRENCDRTRQLRLRSGLKLQLRSGQKEVSDKDFQTHGKKQSNECEKKKKSRCSIDGCSATLDGSRPSFFFFFLGGRMLKDYGKWSKIRKSGSHGEPHAQRALCWRRLESTVSPTTTWQTPSQPCIPTGCANVSTKPRGLGPSRLPGLSRL